MNCCRPQPTPPQIALISMLTMETMPVSGAVESSMALTEPLFTCVVSEAQSADASDPRRTSLPSISAASAAVAE